MEYKRGKMVEEGMSFIAETYRSFWDATSKIPILIFLAGILVMFGADFGVSPIASGDLLMAAFFLYGVTFMKDVTDALMKRFHGRP